MSSETNNQRLIIKAGTLVEPDQGVRTGDILIEDGKISKIGTDLDATGARVINARGKIVMPGLVSAHTHITTTLDRGLNDTLPLEAWLMYTVHGGIELSEREYYVSAVLGAAELLLSGTTSLFDNTPVHPERLPEQAGAAAQACVDVGIRAVVAPYFADFNFTDTLPLHLIPGGKSLGQPSRPPAAAEDLLAAGRSFLSEWHDRHPLVQPSLAPSSPHRCTDALLLGTAELLQQFNAPFQTHVDESKSNRLMGFHRFGHSTIAHLNHLGLLGPNLSLAHTVWVDAEDIRLLAGSGTKIVHNPLANMKLGSGIAPIQLMLELGVEVALGADGPGCGDSLNMFEATKLAALMHKLYGNRERWVDARQALSLCLYGGAAVMDRNIGRLITGAEADVVILDGEPYFYMADDGYMLRQLIYSEPARSVETVLVGGRIVVEDQQLTTVDLQEMRKKGQEVMDRVFAHLPQREAMQARVQATLDEMHDRVRQTPYPYTRWTLDPIGNSG